MYLVERLENNLKNELVNILNSNTRMLDRENQVSIETKNKEVEDWYYEDRKLTNLFGLLNRDKIYYTKNVSYDETSIQAGRVLSVIREIRDSLESKLNSQATEAKAEFRKDFKRQVFQGIKDICENGERIERKKINNAVEMILEKVPSPNFEIKHPIPSSIEKRGRLVDDEAKRFSQDADNYMYNKLKPAIKKEINDYIADVIKTLDLASLAGSITTSLEKEINQLVKEIENKEESKEKYNRILKELNKLKLEIK